MKYVITNIRHPKYPQLRRIKKIATGEYGGYIQYSYNLAQDDESWVADTACVFGNSRVYNNSIVAGTSQISGNSYISNSLVLDNSIVIGGSVHGVVLNGNSQVYNSTIESSQKNKTIFTNIKLDKGSDIKLSDKIINTECSWEYGLLGRDEAYAIPVNITISL